MLCHKFTRASRDVDKYCDANMYKIEEEKIILAGDFLPLLPTVPGSWYLGIWILISMKEQLKEMPYLKHSDPFLIVGSEVFLHLPLNCVDMAAVGNTSGDGQLTLSYVAIHIS